MRKKKIRKRGRPAGPCKRHMLLYKKARRYFATHRPPNLCFSALGIPLVTYIKWYKWWLRNEAPPIPEDVSTLKPKERRKILELLVLYKKLNPTTKHILQKMLWTQQTP